MYKEDHCGWKISIFFLVKRLLMVQDIYMQKALHGKVWKSVNLIKSKKIICQNSSTNQMKKNFVHHFMQTFV